MKTIATLLALLVAFLILRPLTISAFTPTVKSAATCEYEETRENVPINPETNKPYTPVV